MPHVREPSWLPRAQRSGEPAVEVGACLLEVFGCRVRAERKKPGVDLMYPLTMGSRHAAGSPA